MVFHLFNGELDNFHCDALSSVEKESLDILYKVSFLQVRSDEKILRERACFYPVKFSVSA